MNYNDPRNQIPIPTKTPMNNELKITTDRVLAAAAKCSTAKEVLKEMFPEAFKDDKVVRISESFDFLCDDGMYILGRLERGQHKKCAFWLDTTRYDWKMVETEGQSLLIPTRK